MRLLYIVNKSINMNTSASIRNKATILGLIELGHSVDVLTPAGSSSHPSFDESLNISSEQIKMLYIPINSKLLNMKNGIRKLKKITNSLYNTKRKFDIYSGETISISRIERLNLNYKKYDLIISSSDPKASHLLAEQIIDKNALKIPWIQIWGDPFLGDITNNNYVNKKEFIMKKKNCYQKQIK
ncbi:hypothetical protein [Massilimicrobiota timonensis]|uniref:hypothetical protein n=1 Tax=Massilimicrobiota timonensis TaxID=1776392 RepID=UPI00101C9488|nr:hypothetical protein [Massilimicrobiota timonensis]